MDRRAVRVAGADVGRYAFGCRLGQAMTQEKFAEYKERKAWWKDAERSFKFPDPPKK